MKIAISSDHRGTRAVELLADGLREQGHDVWTPLPCEGTCDYPERAAQVAQRIVAGESDRAILVCGTGIGMSIAANKVTGVRAACVQDELSAKLARSHNDANVLCLSGDLLGVPLMERLVTTWLEAEFEGGRHQRRIDKIAALERGEDPAGVR